MLKTRLKELRAEKRITQEQLAEAVGLERSSIGKYEGNQNVVPSVEILNAIADYFGVTTDYLLGRTNLYIKISSNASMVAEASEDCSLAFNRKEFEGLTQSEIDKLAIYAEGLKAGRQNEG